MDISASELSREDAFKTMSTEQGSDQCLHASVCRKLYLTLVSFIIFFFRSAEKIVVQLGD